MIGNTLEYGRGYTPHGEHPAMACGMEVVLANGDVVRTGMGGMSASKTWNAYPWSFGPSHGGLFFQSNFGVVTKMGVWLMRQPEVFLSGWARFDDDAAIAPFADAVRELMLDGTLRALPLLGYGLRVGDAELALGAEELGDALRPLRAPGDRRAQLGDRARRAHGDPRRRGRAAHLRLGRDARPPKTTTTRSRAAFPGWS